MVHKDWNEEINKGISGRYNKKKAEVPVLMWDVIDFKEERIKQKMNIFYE